MIRTTLLRVGFALSVMLGIGGGSLLLLAGHASAQTGQRNAVYGDPPLAELITLSAPDEDGLVTIEGHVGAVFPGAVLAIRNMYTGETIYQRAELTGAFLAQIYAPGNTPLWISPAARIDPDDRWVPGSLPGGPGVILSAERPDAYPPLTPAPAADLPETPLTIDGDAADWAALGLEGVALDLGSGHPALLYTLVNQESLYLALVPQSAETPLPETYGQLELSLEIEGRAFSVTIDPLRQGGGRVAANGSDRGPLAGISAQADALEMRAPRLAFTGAATPILLRGLRLVPPCCAMPTPDFVLLDLEVSEFEAVDPRGVTALAMPEDAEVFSLGGPVGGGSGHWDAIGRINRLDLATGEPLRIELQVTLDAPNRVTDTGDLRLGARLRLEPVLDGDGAQTIADRATGNGWSGLLTPGGLAIQNVAASYDLGDAAAQNLQIDGDRLTFVLQWDVPLGDDLPAGVYVPSLEGFAAVAGVSTAWGESGVLGSATAEGEMAGVPAARLPLVIRVDAASEGRLLMALFAEDPANSGARGLLPQEDAGQVALGDRVAHPAERYILPRVDSRGELIPYALEPYLPALLGNSATQSLAPLLPLVLPGGQLTVTVTRPDGTVDDLGSFPIVQNRLSSVARIEAQAFGKTNPLDLYRLTTLDPRLTAYTFDRDGHYVIRLVASVFDVWGNVYSGGGTYDVWLGDAFALRTGVLLGTSFEVGDVFNPALTVAPAYPAEVSVKLTVYPLDGSVPREYAAEGTANRYGFFLPQTATGGWTLDTPGEYTVDYLATYTDARGHRWFASQRGAGVIASPQGTLVARGGRGVSRVPTEDRLAWYALDHSDQGVLAEVPDARLRWPYHSGDVLWATDGRTGGIEAVLRLTDTVGTYADWLLVRLRGWLPADGVSAAKLANEDELPLVTPGNPDSAAGPGLAGLEGNQIYAYINAARPGLAVRQFVLGDESEGFVESGWTLNDPYAGQRGSGVNGDLPDDTTFLFGGVIVHNADLDLHEAAIYGALSVTIDAEDTLGDRVYPPVRGAAGGADGGPLFLVREEPMTLFFVPTGFQPGQVFTVGQTLALSGQVGPTLATQVRAEVTRPDGMTLVLGGQANAVGYFYDPAQNLTLDQAGIWRIRLNVQYEGLTSAGQVVPPYPSGGVPGAADGEFAIFVLPDNGPEIELSNPLIADGLIQAAQPFNVTAIVPDGWTNIRADYVVTIPGYILEAGQQPALGGIFAYNYDPRRINGVFPNLDITQPGNLPYSADAVTISFVLSGQDADGQPVIGARIVTLFGDRLLTVYDGWPPAAS